MAVRTKAAEPGYRMCECGDQERAHRHHRRGTNCSLCLCPEFRAADAPLISTGRAFLAALAVIATVVVVVCGSSMLANLP